MTAVAFRMQTLSELMGSRTCPWWQYLVTAWLSTRGLWFWVVRMLECWNSMAQRNQSPGVADEDRTRGWRPSICEHGKVRDRSMGLELSGECREEF